MDRVLGQHKDVAESPLERTRAPDGTGPPHPYTW